MKSTSFERHVLRFICAVGIVRLTLELYHNYFMAVPSTTWIVDGGFILVLCAFLLVSYLDVGIKYLSYPVSILGLFFFIFGWFDQGGLVGRSEYNFMIFTVIMAILHSGRSQLVFVGIALLSQLLLVVIWNQKFELVGDLVTNYSTSYFHFILVIVVVAIMVVFLRIRHDLEGRKLLWQETHLSEKSNALDVENEKLKVQQEEFELINRKLEREIAERKAELNDQSSSLKEFIEISVKEFYPPLKGTLDAITQMEKKYAESENMSMLVRTGNKLASAYDDLKVKLKDDIS